MTAAATPAFPLDGLFIGVLTVACPPVGLGQPYTERLCPYVTQARCGAASPAPTKRSWRTVRAGVSSVRDSSQLTQLETTSWTVRGEAPRCPLQ